MIWNFVYYIISSCGVTPNQKNKTNKMNIVKHSEQNIRRGNHKKHAKFGS